MISVAIWQEDGGVEEMERAGEKGGGDLDDEEEEEVLVQEYHSEDEGAPEKELVIFHPFEPVYCSKYADQTLKKKLKRSMLER